MKLAQALSERADIQRKLMQLKERILRNAKVQEGEEPAEDPYELLSEYEQKAEEIRKLVVKINRTNNKARFDKDNSLADILARRDVLAMRRDLLFEVAKSATVTQQRYKALEIKFKGAVNVKEAQKKADALAKEYRELDIKIQELNWSVDLIG